VKKVLVGILLAAAMIALVIPSTFARGDKPKFKVAWSIYVGWMPWPYAEEAGILKKWADKNGIELELVQMDYIPSVEAYVAGKVDACVMTNMEALDMPSASGIDTTAIIVGDFSNGNDAICTVGIPTVKDLAGKSVSLVELSVSHYLLARALDLNGIGEKSLTLTNTSDSDIAPAFLSNSAKVKAVVTWNPMVMQVATAPNVATIFTSANIPGEILDLMVVRTEALKANPALGRALTGAWYETMKLMCERGGAADAALTKMATRSGANLAEFKSQLGTTAMFYTAESALQYVTSGEIRDKMEFVRKFCFSHGLLGENASSVDVVGISYPDGSVQGDKGNVKLRFDASFMKLAAEGQLSK